MDKHYETYQIKLYKGVVFNVCNRYGYMGRTFLKWSYQLKALFPFSYISNYSTHTKDIAKNLNLDVRTLKKRISKLIAHQFAYMEGDTLRLASNTAIKKHFATKTRNRYKFHKIEAGDISLKIDSQSLFENIRKQEQAQAMKRRNDSSKKLADCKSSFQEIIKQAPHAKQEIVDTTLISQSKAAHLYGYKSKTSGYRLLKRLSVAGCAEIESNIIELNRAEYNRYKNANNTKVMIKDRGKDATFYYLVANTIHIKKSKPINVTGIPYYLNDNW